MRNVLRIVAVIVCVSGLVVPAGATDMDGAVRPVTNPVWLGLPSVQTLVHPIFMYHSFPRKVSTEIGDVEMGGDLQLYALQFEVALTENLSLIAVKDGFIDFNPDNDADGAFSSETGMGDLAAGLKWVFLNDEDKHLLCSVRLVAELPTGDAQVWQGNGDGTLAPAVSILKIAGPLQFVSTLGYIQALDNDESSLFYNAWHMSYSIKDKVFPLVEINHFHVTDEGNGDTRFRDQVGGAVPAVAQWEGGDLVNLGSSNGDDNADYVTLGVGARFRVNDRVDLGAAYEIPLTDDEDGITDYRVTADMVWKL